MLFVYDSLGCVCMTMCDFVNCACMTVYVVSVLQCVLSGYERVCCLCITVSAMFV